MLTSNHIDFCSSAAEDYDRLLFRILENIISSDEDLLAGTGNECFSDHGSAIWQIIDMVSIIFLD